MAASLFRDFGLADRLLELALERVFVEMVSGDFACSGVRTKGGRGKSATVGMEEDPLPRDTSRRCRPWSGNIQTYGMLANHRRLANRIHVPIRTPKPLPSDALIHVPGRKTISPTRPIGETGDDPFWMRRLAEPGMTVGSRIGQHAGDDLKQRFGWVGLHWGTWIRTDENEMAVMEPGMLHDGRCCPDHAGRFV
jgi:hypothetical protein